MTIVTERILNLTNFYFNLIYIIIFSVGRGDLDKNTRSLSICMPEEN